MSVASLCCCSTVINTFAHCTAEFRESVAESQGVSGIMPMRFVDHRANKPHWHDGVSDLSFGNGVVFLMFFSQFDTYNKSFAF